VRLVGALKQWVGAGAVVERKPAMIGEDFGRYGRTEDRIPIAMFFTGAVSSEALQLSRQSGDPLPSLHSARFAPDPEPTLKTGMTFLVATVLELAPAR